MRKIGFFVFALITFFGPVISGCASIAQSLDNERRIVAAEAPNGVIQAVPMPARALDVSKPVSRIVIASCAQQNNDQSLWDKMVSESPDLTLYIGDNVYGDVRSNDPALPELKAAYMRLSQSKPFARLRAAAPMLTVWDDHDYGLNDAGGEYEYKESAEALFEYVWDVQDERAARPGVYGSKMIGDEGRRVQVIMLDTRFFRSTLKETDEFGARGKERYLPDADPTKTMLGDAQWAWLEAELAKPADLRLLVSSVQVIADGHGYEAWRTLPRERERLYALIDDSGANGVVIVSGDRHSAALYRRDGVNDYPLYELTASSVNLPASSAWRNLDEEPYKEPGPHRLGDMFADANYAVMDIDWRAGVVAISVRDENGAGVREQAVNFRALK